MEPIRSRTNPHLKRVRKLQEKGGRDLIVIEGPRLLEEASSIQEAFFSPRAHARNSTLVAGLQGRGIPVHLVDERLLNSLSDLEASQGALAVAARPAFDEDAIFKPPALVPVFCGIQNPGNLGALFRTAEAAGASGALLTRGTADPMSPKALRGSMGSALRLPHAQVESAEDAIEVSRKRKVEVVATSRTGGVPYDAFDWRGGVVLLLGNEGQGLPAELVSQADVTVSIPLERSVESLNVAAAAAVILFEAARQRRKERV